MASDSTTPRHSNHTIRPAIGPMDVIRIAASITSPTVVMASITAPEYTPMAREDELIDQRHNEVLDAIKGVHDRLDTLNGRTRTLENKVSVLSWAYGLGAGFMSYLFYVVTGKHQ